MTPPNGSCWNAMRTLRASMRRLDERYRRAGVFDFDDCILYAERLIREHPAVRSAVADRISHVMVDEYQDTNYAQAKLVETLVAGHRNLFVVADDDQSIYKFRGASRANLDRFTREYPEHRQLVLTHNYRSTDQIVAASRAVIAVASPATRIDKQLIADRGSGTAVEVWRAPGGAQRGDGSGPRMRSPDCRRDSARRHRLALPTARRHAARDACAASVRCALPGCRWSRFLSGARDQGCAGAARRRR